MVAGNPTGRTSSDHSDGHLSPGGKFFVPLALDNLSQRVDGIGALTFREGGSAKHSPPGDRCPSEWSEGVPPVGVPVTPLTQVIKG